MASRSKELNENFDVKPFSSGDDLVVKEKYVLVIVKVVERGQSLHLLMVEVHRISNVSITRRKVTLESFVLKDKRRVRTFTNHLDLIDCLILIIHLYLRKHL